jgi:hypothetical protein
MLPYNFKINFGIFIESIIWDFIKDYIECIDHLGLLTDIMKPVKFGKEEVK